MIKYDVIVMMHSGVLRVPWIETHTVAINCDRSTSAGRGYWISV